jgi:acyl transferase domain-containing protein
LHRAVADAGFRETGRMWISTLSRGVATDSEIRTPQYWTRCVREAGDLPTVVAALPATGVSEVFRVAFDAPVNSGLAPEMRELSRLFAGGTDVDWARLFPERASLFVELPTYPFQRERYWPGDPE